MLSEPARILAVSGDQVQIETSRKSSCGKCQMKSGCGQYLLGAGRETLWLKCENLDVDATALVPGSTVMLGAQGGSVAGLALVFYLLPLGGLMLATFFASRLTSNEAWLALSAIAGLVAGLALLPVVLPASSPRLRCTLVTSHAPAPVEFQESVI